MMIATGTLASVNTDPAQNVYNDKDYEAVFIELPAFHWVFKGGAGGDAGDLTDAEIERVEKRLDAEDREPKITFGSAKEAINFLRSRIKRFSA